MNSDRDINDDNKLHNHHWIIINPSTQATKN